MTKFSPPELRKLFVLVLLLIATLWMATSFSHAQAFETLCGKTLSHSLATNGVAPVGIQ